MPDHSPSPSIGTEQGLAKPSLAPPILNLSHQRPAQQLIPSASAVLQAKTTSPEDQAYFDAYPAPQAPVPDQPDTLQVGLLSAHGSGQIMRVNFDSGTPAKALEALEMSFNTGQDISRTNDPANELKRVIGRINTSLPWNKTIFYDKDQLYNSVPALYLRDRTRTGTAMPPPAPGMVSVSLTDHNGQPSLWIENDLGLHQQITGKAEVDEFRFSLPYDFVPTFVTGLPVIVPNPGLEFQPAPPEVRKGADPGQAQFHPTPRVASTPEVRVDPFVSPDQANGPAHDLEMVSVDPSLAVELTPEARLKAFNSTTGAILAHAYAAFPEMIPGVPATDGPKAGVDPGFYRSTMRWLEAEDYIRFHDLNAYQNGAGEILRNPQADFNLYTLTAKGLGILTSTPKAIKAKGESLGDAMVGAAKKGAKDGLGDLAKEALKQGFSIATRIAMEHLR